MKKIITGIALIFAIHSLIAQNWTSARLSQPTASVSTTNSDSQKSSVRKGRKAGESDFYFRLYSSYGLSAFSSYRANSTNISSDYVAVQTNTTTNTTSINNYNDNPKGLGQGLRAGLGLGFIASDFINIGLDVDYYLGTTANSKYDYKYNYDYFATTQKDVNYKYSGSSSVVANMITFTPNIMFKAVSESNFSIYNRAGLCIALVDASGKTSESSFDSGSTNTTVSEESYSYDGGIGLGFMAGIGGQLSVGDAVTLFIELQYTNIGYKPQKRITDQYIQTERDPGDVIVKQRDYIQNKQVGSNPNFTAFTTRQKEIEYVKSYTEKYVYVGASTTEQPSPNEPRKETTFRIPINTIGLQVGMIFRF